jgi:Tfp pilus assembly protein PilN
MTEPLEHIPDETVAPMTHDATLPVRVAQVNLLPADVVIGRRQRRVVSITVGVLVAYLGALALIYALKVGEVDEARAARDQIEREVAVLRTEVDSLGKYQRLIDTVENRETLLASAMDGQLSWARILGDLALSFDREASLIGVVATSTGPDAQSAAVAAGAGTSSTPAATPDAEGGGFDVGEPVAQVEFTGYSIEELAPGVEEVLSRFDDADGFFDSYLTTAAEEERGDSEVTNFVGRVLLDDDAYTHRYDDGLPEESGP